MNHPFRNVALFSTSSPPYVVPLDDSSFPCEDVSCISWESRPDAQRVLTRPVFDFFVCGLQKQEIERKDYQIFLGEVPHQINVLAEVKHLLLVG